MKPLTAYFLLGVLPIHFAAAEPSQPVMTAGELQQLCLASDTTSKNVCRVYILGVTQGMAIGLDIADGKASLGRPCVPGTVSADSLAELLKSRIDKSLAASPKEKETDAARFIATLASGAYPCRKTP
jgi:hypothetical protein